jgi:hypothetical protein
MQTVFSVWSEDYRFDVCVCVCDHQGGSQWNLISKNKNSWDFCMRRKEFIIVHTFFFQKIFFKTAHNSYNHPV